MLGGAALFAVLFAAAGAMASTGLSAGGFTPSGTESARVEQALARDFEVPQTDLLFYLPGDVDSPHMRALGRQLTQRLSTETGVARVHSYWSTGARELRAEDGRAALVAVDLSGTDTQAAATAARIVPQVAKSTTTARVSAAGPAWMAVQATEQCRKDLLRAELVAAPLTILILLLAFGSPTAALLPAVIGVFTVTLSTALLGVLTRVMTVSVFATNITAALGFGLAVDYALLVVTRFREEHAQGATVAAAVSRTMRTAGRSVLFSALTVALALCALFVFPLPFLHSMAWAGLSVVALTALATVTVMPALLTLLGERIGNAGSSPPVLERLRLRRTTDAAQGRGRADSPTWRAVAEASTKHPLLLGGTCTLVLLALAVPFAHVQFGIPDARDLPAQLESHSIGERVRKEFPAPRERTLTVWLPATDAQTHRLELSRYAQRLADTAGVSGVETATGSFTSHGRAGAPTARHRRFAAPGTTWLAVTAHASLDNGAMDDLVRQVREAPAPGPHLVGGLPAQRVDTVHVIGGRLTAAAAIAGASTLILLFLFTRSILIPLKALLLAALSLTASLGAMVYVFQEGHLKTLLGDFTVTGQLDVTMPLLTIVIAFGLSVDYEVFLLSRIKEEYLRTGAHTSSVVFGIARTGRLVTAAALIVATAMGALATSGVTPLKIFGSGLALAVLVDATLVRGILVPCLMQLTGKANWWAPAGLSRHHHTDTHPDEPMKHPVSAQHPIETGTPAP
ncbi:membrane protein [Streptomyces cinerochromogenes]|nr:membrane protein [Streptomyces cinerochromogenes]